MQGRRPWQLARKLRRGAVNPRFELDDLLGLEVDAEEQLGLPVRREHDEPSRRGDDEHGAGVELEPQVAGRLRQPDALHRRPPAAAVARLRQHL